MQSGKDLPVTVVSGYLGSGKTTLVNQILRQASGIRIAVLVNDFGNLAIDASLIEAETDNVISLSGGCVCCSYGNDLTAALMDVQAMSPSPEYVVIETSGVALPGAVASSISIMSGLNLNGILVMVNADTLLTLASDRYVGDTISRQLARANIIVLNQCDLITDDKLANTAHWLSKHYPATPMLKTVHAALPLSVVIGNDLTKNNVANTDDNEQHDLTFNTCVLSNLEGINITALHQLLKADNFALARVKGYVCDDQGQCQLVQMVGNRLDSSPCKPPDEALLNRLVCIGDLDQHAIDILRHAVDGLPRILLSSGPSA